MALFTVVSCVLAGRWWFANRFLMTEKLPWSPGAPDPLDGPRAGLAVLSPRAVTERVLVTQDRPQPYHRMLLGSRIFSGPWPLLGILAVQAGLSLRLVWSNTAFSDESLYLWSGRLELAHFLYGTQVPAFPTYFSGAPVIYPIIGAIADSYGGLALARLVSLAFMLGATALLYATTTRLFRRRAALCAAAVFAVLGPVQVLGAFATYDAMAIFLLALGAWLVVRATGRASELCLLAAGLTLALADATKYATALWMPVVIVLAALTADAGGWRRALFRGTRLVGYIGIPLVVALFRFGGHAYVRGVMFTTLARQASGTPASPQTVLADSFNWVGIVFVLALIGTIISFTVPGRTRWICCVLTAAILLAPLHQAQIHTTTSLHKHVIFGAWFAAVVAGYVLDKAAAVSADKGWRVGAVTVAITCFIGVPQATSMFVYGWPNTTQMNAELAKVVPVAGCPCLIAQQSPVRFYLPQFSAEDIVGPDGFSYWNNAERRVQSGVAAYVEAIRVHYFKVVEIDPAENPAIYAPVVRALSRTSGYRLLTSIRIDHWGRKTMQIWRYAGSGVR
jgi:Dolichyl-phosphate-mannose-protein mannosyltransferase